MILHYAYYPKLLDVLIFNTCLPLTGMGNRIAEQEDYYAAVGEL